jgi:transposase-like protein
MKGAAMGYALPVTVRMTDMECGKCGIAFAVPESWRAEKQRDGGGWFCPNGCQRVYSEPDVKKAQRELAAEQERHRATLARMNEAQALADKLQREAKRLRTRAANGVCPCCTRSFVNLRRHMTTKHPDFQLQGAT